MTFDEQRLGSLDLAVAMTADLDAEFRAQFRHDDPGQEDLTFAFWQPSAGASRMTAVLTSALLPRDGERILDGNVAFSADYLSRALASVPEGCGIALLHPPRARLAGYEPRRRHRRA